MLKLLRAEASRGFWKERSASEAATEQAAKNDDKKKEKDKVEEKTVFDNTEEVELAKTAIATIITIGENSLPMMDNAIGLGGKEYADVPTPDLSSSSDDESDASARRPTGTGRT